MDDNHRPPDTPPPAASNEANATGNPESAAIPDDTIVARLQLLSSLLRDFFAEHDIEKSALPGFQKQLFLQSGEFLIPEEALLLRALARSFTANTRFVELGSGVGLLPIMLAGLGYRTGGIEADPRRHALALDILQFLRSKNFAGAEKVELSGQMIPRVAELQIDDSTIALVSNVVVLPQNVDYDGWFKFLASFPAVIINLGRFLERRTAGDSQERLSAGLQEAGFVPRQLVCEHARSAAHYVFFENAPYREHQSVRAALAEGDAAKLASLLDSPYVAIRAMVEQALRDDRHLELKRQILRQRLQTAGVDGDALLPAGNGYLYIEADWVVAEIPKDAQTHPSRVFYVEVDDRIIGTLTEAAERQTYGKMVLQSQLPLQYADNIEHRVAVLLESADSGYLPTPGNTREALFKRQYKGRIEEVGEGVIRGWVANSADADSPSELRLYDGGEYVGRFRPTIARPDVNQLVGTAGHSGFLIPIPATMRDGRPHHVRVFVGNDELTGALGPRLVASFAPGDHAAAASRYRGSIERIDCSEVAGWARDVSSEAPVHVRVEVDGESFCVIRASAFRDGQVGNESRGYHGFALRFPVSLMNGRKRKVAVYIVEGGVKLESRLADDVEFPLRALADERSVEEAPVFHPVLMRNLVGSGLPAPSLQSRSRSGEAAAVDISIIVVNSNGAEKLRQLLESLAAFAPSDSEVVIVDHASSDHSRDVIEAYRARLSLIPIYRQASFSFSDSNNLAARHANGRHLLFASNEIVLVEDCITRMREVLERCPEVGIVGLRLKEPEYCGATQWELRDHHLGVGFVTRLGANARYNNEPTELATEGRAPVSTGDGAVAATLAVTAAFAMVRKADFIAVGGFHAGYFYGYENIDFCLTLERQLAKKAVCVLDAWAIRNRSAVLEQPHQAANAAVVPHDARARANNAAVLQKRWGPTIHYRTVREAIAGDVALRPNPPRVTFVVSAADVDAAADDYRAASELGTALRDAFGWEITFAAKGQRNMARSDVVIFTGHDLVRSDVIGLTPGALLIAWIRGRVDDWIEAGLLSAIHLICCTSQKAVEAVTNATGRKAAWLPLATNPNRFRPMPPVLRHCADVCVAADLLEGEQQAIGMLCPAAEKFSLAVYGAGYSEDKDCSAFARGVAPHYELPEVYASAKIVIDDAPPRERNALNSRVFDALACGALVLTNCVGGAEEMFGAELPTFSTADELRRLIAVYLGDDERRTRLAASLRQLVVSDHSYAARAKVLKGAITAFFNEALRIAIKVAVPRPEDKGQWGDFYLAQGLRQALERQGCTARIDIMPEWKAGITAGDDVVVVIRGPAQGELPAGPLSLLWLISHPDTISLAELERYDHVFVASQPFADKLRGRLGDRVSTLLQCTDPQLFRPDMACELRDQIIFVGNTRGERQRTMVSWAMEAGLDFRVFGLGWNSLIPRRNYAGDYIANERLGGYYGNGNIILCDHWPDMAAEGFVSNRIFDAAAAGVKIVCDPVAGIEKIFGDLVAVCRTADDLREAVASFDNGARRRRGSELRDLILARHTFDHRAAEIIRLARAALGGGAAAPTSRDAGNIGAVAS